MTSLANQTLAELGGAHSVLARQKRDHIELDRLIDAIDHSTGSRRRQHLNALCRLVLPHAFAEESVLWPAIRRWVPEGEQLTLEIQREHQAINELFTELETLDVNGEEFERLWRPRLVQLLREDVRDEEDGVCANRGSSRAPAAADSRGRPEHAFRPHRPADRRRDHRPLTSPGG